MPMLAPPRSSRPVPPAQARRRLARVGLAWVLLSAAVARADGVGTGTDGDAPPPAQERVRVSVGQVPAGPTDAAGGPQVWQRAVFWQRQGAVELGFGLATRQPAERAAIPSATRAGAPTGSPGAAVALLAIGRPLSPTMSVQIGADIPLGTPGVAALAGAAPAWRDVPGDAADGEGRGELRMGLSLQTRSPTPAWRQGLSLRLELSGSTALTFKPRAGRVSLQLSSRW